MLFLKVHAPITMKVFVGDITVSMEGKSRELPGVARTVLEKIREESRRIARPGRVAHRRP